MEYLVLMVKHNDPVGSYTDRTLGMVIVDTATALQAPGISTQEWFPVRKGPGMRSGDVPQGRVHVKVRFFTFYFCNPNDSLLIAATCQNTVEAGILDHRDGSATPRSIVEVVDVVGAFVAA